MNLWKLEVKRVVTFGFVDVHCAFCCSIVILFLTWILTQPPFYFCFLELGLDVLQKNAMIGGAVTGALVSAASNNKKDKIAIDAITGAAIATAAEFINYLTWMNESGCLAGFLACFGKGLHTQSLLSSSVPVPSWYWCSYFKDILFI